MRHMHSYASRYNVDLHRSLKENGGRHTADGDGAMSKAKFQSVLLSAFQRMTTMFKAHLLEELTALRHEMAALEVELSTLKERERERGGSAGGVGKALVF